MLKMFRFLAALFYGGDTKEDSFIIGRDSGV